MMTSHTKKNLSLSLSVVTAALVLASCASQPGQRAPIKVIKGNQTTQPAPKPEVIHKPTVAVPDQTPSKATRTESRQQPVVQPTQKVQPSTPVHYANFGQWRQDFITRALSKGANAHLLNSMMANAQLNQRVIDLDKNQAEFTKMPWVYVESAASSARISQGKTKLKEQQATLSASENLYGVPKEITTAIWGMESGFGSGMGSMDLVNALSSLAYDGRRRQFAEEQLIAMVKMMERGDATLAQFKGSWAGGMGHTQFIPSTWMAQAVDGNHDGRKNPWHASDALNSTASYLSQAGWVRGLAPFYEVRLPSGFDYRLINQGKRSLDAWRQLGLSAISGESFGGRQEAELWLPAGKNGPALLLTKNFEVIRVYNNSSSYALGVSLLAKRMAGGTGIVQPWPRHEQPLSRLQVQNLQRNLTVQGYDTGGVDGVAGANTRRAFARWQADHGYVPDGFISLSSVGSLVW